MGKIVLQPHSYSYSHPTRIQRLEFVVELLSLDNLPTATRKDPTFN